MECGKSNFVIGLGVGSIIGALVYRFCMSPKGKMMKEKVNGMFHKVTGDAVDMIDTAKDKALDSGTKVADKVADGAFEVAEKTDDVRNKMHTYASNAKK